MRQIKKYFTVLLVALIPILMLTSCHKDGEKPEHVHNFVQKEVVAPTCTSDGYTTFLCECGEEEHRDKVAALGHSYGAWVVVKTPTVLTVGVKEKVCSRCNDTIKEDVPVLEENHVHSYGLWEVAKNPTIDSKGLLTRNCIDLDSSETKELPVLNDDDYTIPSNTLVNATCTKIGSKEYVYSFDNQVFSFKIDLPMLAHTLVESHLDATCTTTGFNKKKCSVCDYEEVEVISALGHDANRNGHECEADLVCQRCNAVIETKQAHKLNEEYTAATCSNVGHIKYVCEYCNETIKDITINKLDHTLSEYEKDGVAVQSKDDICLYLQKYTATCSECNQSVSKYENVYKHNYELKATKLATCTTSGSLTYKCSNCNNSYDVSLDINSEAHNYILKSNNDNKIIYSCDNCSSEKVVLNHSDSTEANVDINSLKETKGLELKGNTSITLDDTLLNNIKTNVTISANTIEKDSLKLTEENKKLIGNNPIYDFKMLDSEKNNVDFNGGKVKIRIPYTLAAGESPTDIGVWYINDAGEPTSIKATYVDGFAVFETEHFSYYAVSKLANEDKCRLYGHKYINGFELKPTCTDDGYLTEICSVCGDKKINEISKLGHNFKVTTDVDATCTVIGLHIETCENCGITKEIYKPALGHDYELNTETYVKATCQNAGHEEYKCKNCDSHYETNTMQLNHQYQDEVVDPTCDTDGYTIHTCISCKNVVKDTYVKALGHNYVSSVIEPTCTEKGYTLFKCSRCDESYKTNETAPHHTWNVVEPTCGVSQKCLVCGAFGLPKTNNHSYNPNGVCIICGEGCNHNYAETVYAATCTKDGYTLKICENCGHSEKTNVVSKTGHKGNIICEICGERIISSEYLNNLLFSISSYNSFTISAKNIVVKIEVNKDTNLIEVSNLKLTLKLDENNKLYGYGYFTLNENLNGALGEAKIYAYVKDGYANCIASESYIADIKKADYTYSHTEKTYDEKDHYYRISLDEIFKSIGIGNINEMLSMIDETTLNKLSEAYKKILTNDEYLANKVVAAIIDKLFVLDNSTSEYKLSLSLNYFVEIYNYAKTHTISELVDYATKENTFANVYNYVKDLDKLTIKNILDYVKETGLTLQEIIDILNAYLPGDSDGNSFEDMINSILQNNGQSLVDYLTSSAVSEKNLFNFIKELSDNNIDLTTYQTQILNMLDQVKDANLFDLILGEEKNEVLEVIDLYVDAYKDILTTSIYTNSIGEISKIKLGFNGIIELPDTSIDSIINLDITFGDDVTIPNNLTAKIDTLYGFDFIESIKTSGFELIKNDNDEAIGFVYTRTDKFDNSYDLGNGLKEVRNTNYKYVYNLYFDDLKLNYIDSDCRDWYLYDFILKNEDNFEYTVYRNEVVKTYYNGEIVSSSKSESSNVEYTNHLNVRLFYNTKTNKFVVANDYNTTMHDFKLVESVEPVGCDTYGYDRYVCSVCGYQKTEYEVNGHHNVTYTYELINPNGNCEDGVKVTVHCEICDKTYVERNRYYHDYDGEYVLADGSESCEDGLVWKETCRICNDVKYNYNNTRNEHMNVDYDKIDLSKYGVSGGISIEKCKTCGKILSCNINIKEQPTSSETNEETNTITESYNNGRVIINVTTISSEIDCIVTVKKHIIVKGDGTTICEYDEFNQYSNHESTERTVTNGNKVQVTTLCEKCNTITNIETTTYYGEPGNSQVSCRETEYYEYYSNTTSLYSYVYQKVTYDEAGNYKNKINERKQYKNGMLELVDYSEYFYINDIELISLQTYMHYEDEICIDGEKYEYSYDTNKCTKTTITYRIKNGTDFVKVDELKESYHIATINVKNPTCTQFGENKCACGQITYIRPLGHKYSYSDNHYVCEKCGSITDDPDQYVIGFEELNIDNSIDVFIGYCYYSTKYDFSNPLAVITINNQKFDFSNVSISSNVYDDNTNIISGIYTISISEITSLLNKNNITNFDDISLELYVIESNTKAKYSITISLGKYLNK